jgi:mycothiol system anti-sigma-R factor
MKCLEVIERLFTFLDRELSEGEMREVRGHLEACPPCVRLFRFEEGVRRLVKRSCSEVRASADLRERIERALHQSGQ